MSAPDSPRCARCDEPEDASVHIRIRCLSHLCKTNGCMFPQACPRDDDWHAFVAPVETAPRTRTMDCPLKCEMPIELVEVPTPRHAWGGVIVCPNVECDRRRAFMVPPETKADDRPMCDRPMDERIADLRWRVDYDMTRGHDEVSYPVAVVAEVLSRVSTPQPVVTEEGRTETPPICTACDFPMKRVTLGWECYQRGCPDPQKCYCYGQYLCVQCEVLRATPVDTEPTREQGPTRYAPDHDGLMQENPAGSWIYYGDHHSYMARVWADRDAEVRTLTTRLQALEAAAREVCSVNDSYRYVVPNPLIAAINRLRSLTPTTQDHDGR